MVEEYELPEEKYKIDFILKFANTVQNSVQELIVLLNMFLYYPESLKTSCKMMI